MPEQADRDGVRDAVLLMQAEGNRVEIDGADLTASNGTLHVVDGVLGLEGG